MNLKDIIQYTYNNGESLGHFKTIKRIGMQWN